jgi:hypothetical protein
MSVFNKPSSGCAQENKRQNFTTVIDGHSRSRSQSCYKIIVTPKVKTISTKLLYTGRTQKNGAVSKVNKQFMSHLTRAQHTPSAAATVQVSDALPAVRLLLIQGIHKRMVRFQK